MATMQAMVVNEAGGDLVLQEREVPQPGFGEVLVRVHACGVCHSDSLAKEGGFPVVSWPVIPGHEIAGEIAALGDHAQGWEVGQRVGVGWFGGNCGYCEPCRRGQLIDCVNMAIPGVTMDGGYAEYVVVRAAALAAMPDGLSPEEAGPLMCAGITTFNALRTSGATGGDRVGILGVGGLGHLAVQFATRLGFETVAIARGTDKEHLARRLGAHHYVDSAAGDPSEALQTLGGVDLILSTITNAEAMGAVFGGLRPQGKLMLVGIDMDPLPIPEGALISGDKVIEGHASGTSIDSEDTLRFQCALRGPADDRDGAARRCRRGLRKDDERRRPFPHGADGRGVMTVPVVGINHIALEVDDLDEALAWDARFFALELRGRRPGA